MVGFSGITWPLSFIKTLNILAGASCLEYLLNLSKYTHLLALIFVKQMKDDKKTQWSVNKSNKKCPLEHIHI